MLHDEPHKEAKAMTTGITKLTKPERVALGQTLLSVLAQKDLTQMELADYLKVHRSYMSRMMAGKSNITKHLPSIGKWLSMDADELIKASPVLERQPLGCGGVLPDADGGWVLAGVRVQTVDRTKEALPMGVGRFVLLGPAEDKPGQGLRWVLFHDGTHFLRRLVQDGRDARKLVLLGNVPSDAPFCIEASQIAECRPVLSKNVHLDEGDMT
jgi:transcriptional regulator with XRE-family HTH domain